MLALKMVARKIHNEVDFFDFLDFQTFFALAKVLASFMKLSIGFATLMDEGYIKKAFVLIFPPEL